MNIFQLFSKNGSCVHIKRTNGNLIKTILLVWMFNSFSISSRNVEG